MKHRIRLAGPWEWRNSCAPQQDARNATRCQLPFPPSGDQLESGIILTRRFHCPTGINDRTALRIVLQATSKPGDVQLNGNTLPSGDAGEESEYSFSVNGRVEPFNQLCVLLLPRSGESAALQNAWLEIED